MSWLKKVTGMQELIDKQEINNNLLSGILGQIVQLNQTKPEQSEIPRIKKYKK